MGILTGTFKLASKGVNLCTDRVKSALAANNAHRANEAMADARDAARGETHGTIYNVVEAAGDLVADTVNVATLGMSRRITNIFDDDDSKLDYKSFKKANLDSSSTIQERANLLVNDSVIDQAGTTDAECER